MTRTSSCLVCHVQYVVDLDKDSDDGLCSQECWEKKYISPQSAGPINPQFEILSLRQCT